MTEMLWINLLGDAAFASVLATFCMNSMVPLRVVAICSNVLFDVPTVIDLQPPAPVAVSPDATLIE